MPNELQKAGCTNCPVQKCDAIYRSSRCSTYRARIGVDFDPQTNFEMLSRLDQDELRTFLVDYFFQWARCEDSYIYDLIRVKEAFAVGTMTFDDFVPWSEERVEELVDDFIVWLKEPVNWKKTED